MDPVTFVVTALAAGATTGLQDTVADAIKDAYAWVKRLLSERYADINVSQVEAKPQSENYRNAVAEALADAHADTDPELLAAAKALWEAVQTYAPESPRTAGLILSRIDADEIDASNIAAAQGSIGVQAEDIKARRIRIADIQSGGRPTETP